MNIPQLGPSAAKTKFYKEVAVAFEFLALFYSLSEADQLELMQLLTSFEARAKVGK